MRLCIGSTRLFFNTVAAGLMSVISDNNLLISVEPLEERFFVSSREFCPAHRRRHRRFALMAYCASVFACACSVLLFTCLHTYTGYK